MNKEPSIRFTSLPQIAAALLALSAAAPSWPQAPAPAGRPPAGAAQSAKPGAGAGGISVVSGSYGLNVDPVRAKGNVTADVAQSCNGKSDCEYRVDFHRIGDPFPGKAKAYDVAYRCGQGPERHATAGAEAGFGSVVSLSCGVAEKKGLINVSQASYGANVNAQAAAGNATGDIAQACNGQSNCSYRVDFHRIGDPFPGRPKTYDVSYGCGDGQVHRASAAAEAGFGSLVSLHCP